MDDYKRLIAYIYEYDGRVRLGNKGFARIDVRNGFGRLFVSMKDMKKDSGPLGVYFYRWNGGIMQSMKVDEMKITVGSGELKSRFKSDDISGGISFDEVSGLIVGCSGGKMYGAEWDERDINMLLLDINGARVQEMEAAECVPEIEQDMEGREQQEEEAGVRSETHVPSMTGDWREIFDDENLMQPFDDDMMYDCVEVTPELMRKVPFSERNLYNNSFLLHGYFHYGHLLIGKLARPGEGERYFVGIPGTYNNRERIVASMYGFDNFRKSIRRDYHHPYFGYWYTVVDAG